MSTSPRNRDDRDDLDERNNRRSHSPDGRDRDRGRERRGEEVTDAPNNGANLFVTGVSPRVRDEDLSDLFSKFGKVEKAQVMRDPHTKDSRGFAFVAFEEISAADLAREALSGTEFFGKTLVIEKAKRSSARAPTPGHYYGPAKRYPEKRFDSRDRFDPRYESRSYDRYDRPSIDRFSDRPPVIDRYAPNSRGYDYPDRRDYRDRRPPRSFGGPREFERQRY
ncbi:hypothetical protein HK099_002250 [Clydaea vesicula]|uniref:RRM domain-containing protein n=1 Tax=Clydaea vesicula TaxID=447962 RepID=A0AAD5XWT1_9FUNG|nr:hypothetical protein HK099_002250 [Clydaea vesicula]KAJ3386694.1 hypothetical protein HDU92_002345 [Lobulomyces angularis]